jgi:hypothetical protein
MTKLLQTQIDKWVDLCFHPTPSFLVTEFGKATVSELFRKESRAYSSDVKILDMFCGDGRLGVEVADLIQPQVKGSIQLLLADVSPKSEKKLQSKTQSINCFEHNWVGEHTVVVANPPFLIAKELNVAWLEVTKSGRNLYSLAALKCLDACRPGGLVALIAPFSWIRGNTFQSFRKSVSEICDSVDIYPCPGKGNFEDVQQEIAFQFFWKKTIRTKEVGAIRFHGGSSTSLHELNSIVLEDFPARVGALVWNRTTHRLAASTKETKGALVVYGGNIQGNKSRLVLDHGRYTARQRIVSTPNESDFFNGPGILLRRTVRGRPDAWRVDAIAVGKGFKGITENHVVSVGVPKNWNIKETKLFRRLFVVCLQKIHAPSGSATLNQHEVRAAIVEAKKLLDSMSSHPLKPIAVTVKRRLEDLAPNKFLPSHSFILQMDQAIFTENVGSTTVSLAKVILQDSAEVASLLQ